VSSNQLTYARVCELFSYNAETGTITRKKTIAPNAKKGDVAGCIRKLPNRGINYITIRVDNFYYQAHRLAWLLHYGVLPEHNIDHIDGNGLNNAISNLRDVPQLLNAKNQKRSSTNTSGVTGVSRHLQTGKWRAYINDNGQQIALGLFSSKDDAVAARKIASKSLGYAERHGS
jgi:hypothetical protein